jgi:acyl carrier protein
MSDGMTHDSADAAEARIRSILAKHDGVSKGQIDEGVSWSEKLNLDSLSFIGFIVDVQDEFGIEIPDAEAARLASLADVIASVRRHSAPAAVDCISTSSRQATTVSSSENTDGDNQI